MNSINFYENVNRLQEVIERSENRRMDLNREFVAALQSGDSRDKRRLVRIQSYFKQLCENEKRSRDRNIKLLQDIERIEKNMESLSRKTDRLRTLKRQYEDYVGRLYPNWREEMQKQMTPRENGEVLATPKLAPTLSKSPIRDVRTPPAVTDTRSRSIEELFSSKPSTNGDLEVPPLHLSALRSTSSTEKQTPDFPTMSSTGDALTGRSEITAITPMTGKPTLESKREQRVSFDMSTLKKALDSDEDDEEEDEFSAALTSSRTSVSRPETVMKVEIQSNGRPTAEHIEESVLKSTPQTPPNGSSQDLNASINSRLSSSGGYAPSDLTFSGLFNLLQFVEDELERRWRDRSKLGMFYRSSLPAASLASEIKSLANEGKILMHLNPISVSMVVIEELPHLVASMHSGALLTDVILIDYANSPSTFDEDMLISRLPDTKTMSCKRLLKHFKALVRYQVMKPQEVAEAFGSCLINWHSRLEDKAIELLVSLVEGVPVGGSISDETPSVTPRATTSYEPTMTDKRPFGDSMMATAGSFHEMNPLKVTSNPELRSTESDDHLRILKNALRAKEESEEEEEDDDEDEEEERFNKTASLKDERNPSVSIPNESDSEFDVLGGAPQKPTPFLSSSIQSPAVSASLKDSDAYKMMLGKAPARRQSSLSSEDEDLDALLGPVAQPSTLPSVQEGESPLVSESHGQNESSSQQSQSSKRNTTGDIAKSTQELLRSVTAKSDSDSDLEIEYPGQPKPKVTETKPKAANNDDDDFFDFYT